MRESQVPLCVDLDGTLLVGDAFRMGVARLCTRDPVGLIVSALVVLRGRARVKQFVAARSNLDARELEYHPDLMERLALERLNGREIVLVTGADQRIAHAVAAVVGGFTSVVASDGKANLVGHTKAQALLSRYGPRGFDYVGNSYADLPVWASAREGWVVSGEARLIERARRVTLVRMVLRPARVARFKPASP